MTGNASVRVCVVGVVGLLLAPGCGDGDDDQEAADSGEAETTTTVEDDVDGDDALESCLAAEGLELAEPGARDLPLVPFDEDEPLVLEGAQGIGVRDSAGGAVAFVYDSPDAAAAAATTAGGQARGNVVLVVDADFSPEAQDALVDCLG